VVGEIEIVAEEVFDTDDAREDRSVFRLANRLHPTTREQVIAGQLLFASGDPYSRRLLEESERLLRQQRYLYDARVRPVRCRGDRVDVEVVTRDVWTFTGGFHFGLAGGVPDYGFELQETNLLGWGKDLTLERLDDVDRTTTLLRYRDVNLAGGRSRLELWYAQNSDGMLRRLSWGRPFFALDSRWATGVEGLLNDRTDTLYALGEPTGAFRHREALVEVQAGRSAGLAGGWARRWLLGYTWHSDDFSPAEEGLAVSEPSGDRILSYPWLGFELVQDHYREEHDLDRISRTEDVPLGMRLRGRLGWSSQVLGGDRDRAVFAASASGGWAPGADWLLLGRGELAGRWGQGGVENLRAGLGARLYWRDFGRHLLFVAVESDLLENRDGDAQLLLGGDSGLRGYPLRYQDGDHRLQLTVEQRFYSERHLLRLVYPGAAVFFDLGRAWFAGGAEAMTELGTLRDVGAGLRLGLSRSGRGAVLHLDVAFPLDGRERDSVQWLVSTKETF
jgi:hypothetical protein